MIVTYLKVLIPELLTSDLKKYEKSQWNKWQPEWNLHLRGQLYAPVWRTPFVQLGLPRRVFKIWGCSCVNFQQHHQHSDSPSYETRKTSST